MHNPERKLFSDELWEQIVDLVETLTTSQTQWLGQYLTRHDNASVDTKLQTGSRSVVAFGSETGNSRAIAESFVEAAMKQGKNLELINLADAKLRQLSTIHQLFIVCSTHGDGDPPEPIETFYQALITSDKTLEHLSYAVLALGDSTYEKFCESGRQIDEKLSELAASRLLERVDCDVDYQEQAEAWIEQVLGFIKVSSAPPLNLHLVQPERHKSEISKASPAQVEVIENICLSDVSRRNAIHHIELSLANVGSINLSPGDSIGVIPHNPPELIKRILTLLNFTGDESVFVKEEAMPLVQALREHFDLVVVSTKFLKKWAVISRNDELVTLTERDTKVIRDFLKSHHLTDIITQFRAEIDAQTFINLLRPLQPRLYDVANSLKQTADELHLTVERYLYQNHGREFAGIASNFLVELDVSELISIYPQPNKRFRLPTNPSVPLIMVADGTGIAPFRAFIQELAVDEKRQHPTWLIMREQHFLDDFLYQVELQKALGAGQLTRVDTVFYGDNPSITPFDVVADNYELFKGWLEAGAHVYMSGHKYQLEHFETSLGSGLNSDPGISDIWQAMSVQSRIHRNLY